MTNVMAIEMMSMEQLNRVAGGFREEFNEICKLLGKSSTFNTRDGIRKLLKDKYGIEVKHWNTGDRGSENDAPAEFRDITGLWTNQEIDSPMTFEQVKYAIKYQQKYGGYPQ